MNTMTGRRDFLIKVGSVSTVLASGAALSACGMLDDEQVRFDFGVASGDPLSDRVILWTRAKYQYSAKSVPLNWQVATDSGFRNLVVTGSGVASLDHDFTFKVDAKGLAPNQIYYYRFMSGNDVSPVGLTKTLPVGDVESVKFAVTSCANFPAGYFHVYAQVARSDADVAIHLGDYIYEYDANGYASGSAQAMGRVSHPANEVITLADYRLRHAQYKSDPDLKQLHASKPMIAIWDDHEVANDSYLSGAQNHTPATEGSFDARKAAAIQAYHEWMPIRSGADSTKIYRRFDFGNLISLHMLDTRLIGRDKQIEVTDLLNPVTAQAAKDALGSLSRQLLGTEQVQWLRAQMANSPNTWQVIGQQVLMAKMEFPVSILQALNPDNVSPEAQLAGQKAVRDYLSAKGKKAAGFTLDKAEQDLLEQPYLGYNLDAWDGYPMAREVVLGTAAQLTKRLVVLAGDTHNAWHSDLTLQSGAKVGEEFATSSVSSPGFEEYLSLAPSEVKSIFENVVDDLNWMDPSRRGYLKMTFTKDEAKGEWFFVDTVKATGYTVSTPSIATGEVRVYKP